MSECLQTARRDPMRVGGFLPTNTHVGATVHGVSPSFALPSIFRGKERPKEMTKKTKNEEKKKRSNESGDT